MRKYCTQETRIGRYRKEHLENKKLLVENKIAETKSLQTRSYNYPPLLIWFPGCSTRRGCLERTYYSSVCELSRQELGVWRHQLEFPRQSPGDERAASLKSLADYWVVHACEEVTQVWGRNHLKGAKGAIFWAHIGPEIFHVMTSPSKKTSQIPGHITWVLRRILPQY